MRKSKPLRDGPDLARRQQIARYRRIEIGRNLQRVIQHFRLPAKVEIGVVDNVHHRGRIRPGRHPYRQRIPCDAVLRHDIQPAGITHLARRRCRFKDGMARTVIRDPPKLAVQPVAPAMQMVRPLVPVQQDLCTVQHEASARDTVRIAPARRAEVGRMVQISAQVIVPQNHIDGPSVAIGHQKPHEPRTIRHDFRHKPALRTKRQERHHLPSTIPKPVMPTCAFPPPCPR